MKQLKLILALAGLFVVGGGVSRAAAAPCMWSAP